MGKTEKVFGFLVVGLTIILMFAGFVAWIIIGLVFLALWLLWQILKAGAKGVRRIV